MSRRPTNVDDISEVIQPSTDPSAQVTRWECENIDESEHLVQFYETDPLLLSSLSTFVSTGLAQGDVCFVVATAQHLKEVITRLRAQGVDVDSATAGGQFVLLDATETLPRLMVNGSPDASRFADVCKPIEQAIDGGRRVRVFGELVGLLWAEGNHTAAMQLEKLWNNLRQTNRFRLFCAYPLSRFAGEALARQAEAVSSVHSRVLAAESLSGLGESDGHLRAVLMQQQNERSLDLAIAAKEDVERQLRIAEALHRKHCDAIGDGLIILDPETQKITDYNESAKEVLGTNKELLGKELWEVGLFDSPATSREAFRQLNESAFLRYNDHEVSANDASGRIVEVVGSLYSYGDRRVAQLQIRDITERKKSEQTASHFAAIVESSDDAIISKTLEGIILTWNKGAERIFGYQADEVIGKPVLVLIPPERQDEEPIILQKLGRGERIDHYETVRVAKDGRRITISLTISPIKDESGKIIAVSKIARDITAQKRIEEEREQLLAREQLARAQAETANRMKDEFLATVSHELRTPLNAIIGWSHLLSTGRIDGTMASRAMEAIERNARAQAQLVEDILDVSRVISGKLHLNLGPVDLVSVINAAIDSVQPAADSKSIHFAMTLDPSVRRISGDAGRLQQVVWNLLSNAIKFTPQGGLIEVRLEHVASQVQISVSDNGPGISPEFLPYIFDRFRQADGTSTRKHGGLGLGLAIVRHLVELHGGTVHAASSPGKGATFTLRLPYAITDERTLPGRETGSLGSFPQDTHKSGIIPSLEGVRILAVDDDVDNLQVITMLLTGQRAIVHSAASVAEALQVLHAEIPDVLVSDLAMPEEDGFSLINRVRELEKKTGRHLPAVALTAYVRVADRAQALSRGFDMFVPKPVEPSELIAAIASLVGLRTSGTTALENVRPD